MQGKKTVDIDILVVSRNGDRKVMQSTRITSRPPLIYPDNTTLYSKCDQAPDLWQQLGLASELESDL